MNVKIITLTEEAVERSDCRDLFAIEIDGKKVFEVFDGEPEDNTLARNFNAVYAIEMLLVQTYQAGKRQEPIWITCTQVDEY